MKAYFARLDVDGYSESLIFLGLFDDELDAKTQAELIAQERNQELIKVFSAEAGECI